MNKYDINVFVIGTIHDNPELLNYAMRHEGKITKKEAMNIDGVDTYYHNAEKYVGEILSNMVKRGIFKRVKAGHYEIDNTYRQKKIVDKNLPKLF